MSRRAAKTNKKTAFAYLRVSTLKQVEEGESIDAQLSAIKRYADYEGIEIVKVFRDEGASGKSVTGRAGFSAMLGEIKNGAGVDYVIVFKLSRFGRNIADTMVSLQTIQDYGANLVCTEDKLDSSDTKDKLMFTIMAAFAEMERENILVQTMAGRKQKASDGMWNGAQAPFGYRIKKVDNGSVLELNEDEAEIVRLIFKLYVDENKGLGAIAAWLNANGYTKKPRGNMKKSTFSAGYIRTVLDNPVYNGKIAFGRRETQQVRGDRGETRTVKRKDYEVYEGRHEAIIDDETWEAARRKRESNSRPFSKPKKGRANLLTGMLVCPCCGRKMVANSTRGKIKNDGTRGKSTYAYACKYSQKQHGKDCTFTRQYRQEVIDALVISTVKAVSRSKTYEDKIRESVAQGTDEETLRKRVEQIEQALNSNSSAIRKITDQMDHLNAADDAYEIMYEDLQKRYVKLCQERPSIERAHEVAEAKLASAIQGRLTTDHIYQLLDDFAESFDDIPPEEQKERIEAIVERVELNPDPDYDAGESEVSNIVFRVPVTFNVYAADGDAVRINTTSWTPHGNEVEYTRQLQDILTKVFKSGDVRANDDTVEVVSCFKRC